MFLFRGSQPAVREVRTDAEDQDERGGRGARHEARAGPHRKGARKRRRQPALRKDLAIEEIREKGGRPSAHHAGAVDERQLGPKRRFATQVEPAEGKCGRVRGRTEDLFEERAQRRRQARKLAGEQEQVRGSIELARGRKDLHQQVDDSPMQRLEAFIHPRALEHELGSMRDRPAHHVLPQRVGQCLGERAEAAHPIALGEPELTLCDGKALANRKAEVFGAPLPLFIEQQRRRNREQDAVDRTPRPMPFEQLQQRTPTGEVAARGRRKDQPCADVDDDAAGEVMPGDAASRVRGAGKRVGTRGSRLHRVGQQLVLALVDGANQEIPRHAVPHVDAAYRLPEARDRT